VSLWESGEIITKDKLNLKTLYIGEDPPPNPVEGMVWVDTSSTLYLVKIYHNGSWDVARGAPVDRVIAPPAGASDYQTPTAALASSYPFPLEQGAYNSSYWLNADSGYPRRAAQRVYSQYVSGRTVKRVEFCVERFNNPTGTVYFRIRRADNDEIVADLGSLSASSIPTDFTLIGFSGVWPLPSGVDLYFTVEYSGGNVDNRLEVAKYNGDLVGWGNSAQYITSWYQDSSYDLAIKIIFMGEPNDARDDSVNTWWEPSPLNQAGAWISFDLGSVLGGVAGCRIYWHSDANYRPQAYKIQASVDGSSWDDVVVANTQPPAGWVEYSWLARNQTRYLRILVTTPGALGTRIHEFDYYQSSIWRHGHVGD